MADRNTKQDILKSGIRVLYHKGYGGSGLKEILDAATVPKGSFYYFFESKEEFTQKALQSYNRGFDDFFDKCLEHSSLTPMDQLKLFFNKSIVRLESCGLSGGCLVGNMAQELSDTNSLIRTEAESIFTEWSERIAECLERAQAAGQLSKKHDPVVLANFILNSWEGAMLRMKTAQSAKPLHTFVDHIFSTYFECT